MSSPAQEEARAEDPYSAAQVRGAARWMTEFYSQAPALTYGEPDMSPFARAVLGESLFEDIRSLAENQVSPVVQAAQETPRAPEGAEGQRGPILGDTEQDIRQAIGDPGIYVHRLPGELVTFWAARAVMAALGFDKEAMTEWGFLKPADFAEDGEEFLESFDEESARRQAAYGDDRHLAQRIIGTPRKVKP